MTGCSLQGLCVCGSVLSDALIKITVGCFHLYQNLNKQAYDLAKTLLKRTVQTIETCIANVSRANCDSLGRLRLTVPRSCLAICLHKLPLGRLQLR